MEFLVVNPKIYQSGGSTPDPFNFGGWGLRPQTLVYVGKMTRECARPYLTFLVDADAWQFEVKRNIFYRDSDIVEIFTISFIRFKCCKVIFRNLLFPTFVQKCKISDMS